MHELLPPPRPSLDDEKVAYAEFRTNQIARFGLLAAVAWSPAAYLSMMGGVPGDFPLGPDPATNSLCCRGRLDSFLLAGPARLMESANRWPPGSNRLPDWWTTLEIPDQRPILDIDATLVAGDYDGVSRKLAGTRENNPARRVAGDPLGPRYSRSPSSPASPAVRRGAVFVVPDRHTSP